MLQQSYKLVQDYCSTHIFSIDLELRKSRPYPRVAWRPDRKIIVRRH